MLSIDKNYWANKEEKFTTYSLRGLVGVGGGQGREEGDWGWAGGGRGRGGGRDAVKVGSNEPLKTAKRRCRAKRDS